MNQIKLNQIGVRELSVQEQKDVTGGSLPVLAVLAIGYLLFWAGAWIGSR